MRLFLLRLQLKTTYNGKSEGLGWGKLRDRGCQAAGWGPWGAQGHSVSAEPRPGKVSAGLGRGRAHPETAKASSGNLGGPIPSSPGSKFKPLQSILFREPRVKHGAAEARSPFSLVPGDRKVIWGTLKAPGAGWKVWCTWEVAWGDGNNRAFCFIQPSHIPSLAGASLQL